jgi:Domain of unknown function (DUF1707)
VGEVPVVAGPEDEMAAGLAGRGRMRASHADREQAIEVLKDAFVQDRLTKDELDTRVVRALVARTGAELAALTADIPAGTGPVRPPAPARRRPLARAAAGSGSCLVIAAAAVRAAFILDPGPSGPTPYHSWAKPFFFLAIAAILTALGILVAGVAASVGQRRSRRQLPPRPGPGCHALDGERHGGTGHGPVPPGPRTDQTRADLRIDSSRPGGPYSSGRGGRTPRGIRPAPGVV